MKKTSNKDFFEAKARLGLLSVGDPGVQDKLQVTDTFLVLLARKLDAKIKQNPRLKKGLVKIRDAARKSKYSVASLRAKKPTAQVTPAMEKTEIKKLITGIKLPAASHPDVSIIIPAFNKVAYSATCIKSIANNLRKGPSFEVVLVDNGSSDETPLLEGIENLVYKRNAENLGFVGGCNSGIPHTKGEYIVFLNNDTEVTETWLSSLYDTISNDPKVGLAGSKIIYPNGLLQEAGGIIFNDANGLNYGKFDQADSYQYNYVREVDYCSGASIIIRRDLLQEFGGFDKLYQPAYYEDTDLAFKVRQKGLKVVYQPDSVIYHVEGGTAGIDTSSGFKKFQVINKEKFLKRWGAELKKSHVSESDWYFGRDRSGDKLALIIEEDTPTPDKDSGSIRMVAMIKGLQSLGYKVTFWPNNLKYKSGYTHALQQMGVEVVYGNIDFMQFARLFGHAYEVVLMSRPEICAKYVNICRTIFTNAKLIYDTVDLHYVRLARQAEVERVNAEQLDEQSKWYEVLEKGLMERTDATLVVSPKEADILKQSSVHADIRVVSNIHTVTESSYKNTFEDRKDIIFVGNYAHLPNRDAATWFINDIFPTVRKQLDTAVLHIVGANMPKDLESSLAGKNIVVHGFVSDAELKDLLVSSRVFIAPLRYGAGVKGKIGQAIEHGLPVVTTDMGAEGMFLKDDFSCLKANTAKAFAEAIVSLYTDKKLWDTIRKNAKGVLAQHFSPELARDELQKLLKD